MPELGNDPHRAYLSLTHVRVHVSCVCRVSLSLTPREIDKRELKQEFKMHFRNISRIMDCVGCEKCKIHGKLQILGLGTALKILLEDRTCETLQRNEIIVRRTFPIRYGGATCAVARVRVRWCVRAVQ